MEFPKLETFFYRKCSIVALFRYWPLYASEINHVLSPKRAKKEMIKYMTVAKMFSDSTENLKMDKIINF